MAAGVLSLFPQLVGAIVCAAAGFIVWDVGTRSPAQVLADALAACRTVAGLGQGLVRFTIGFVFIGLSIALVFFALPPSERLRYTIYQTGTFVAALAVELLVGDEVRRLLGLRKGGAKPSAKSGPYA